MIQFGTELYRVAFDFTSKEETRYYLNGVFVEPHPVAGVMLTATDGHRLICIRDETGYADESAIIRLDKRELDYHKSAVIENDSSNGLGTRIDGTYPDYKRVIPKVDVSKPFQIGSFNCDYVGSFAKAGRTLWKLATPGDRHFSNAMCVVSNDAGGPALVLFPSTPFAFGVLMPMRTEDVSTVPHWFAADSQQLAKAA